MVDKLHLDPATALEHWLFQRLDATGSAWLRQAVASVGGGSGSNGSGNGNGIGSNDRELFLCVSLVSRKLGKAPLALDREALAMAATVRPDWDPSAWTVDQAARILLLLASASAANGDTFAARLDQLCATADVDELVAFYRGLAVYPGAPRYRLRAAEGVRSNMSVVFEAVAQRNPYPAEQFQEDAWNQMVLKALFLGSTLHAIVGIDRRANANLARMLGDYAHERWAAGRQVSPELWRCVGPFATGTLLADLARVLERGSPPERAAAVLALRSASDPDAVRLLDGHRSVCDAVAAHGVDWTSVLQFN